MKYFLLNLARIGIIAGLLCLMGLPARALAGEFRMAVASNFLFAARALGQEYERESGHRSQSVSGSTGKLYAQVVNGAPFHVFLSADSWRPELLEQGGLGVAGSRFTYALGRISLIGGDSRSKASRSEASKSDDSDCLAQLKSGQVTRLALANPRIAPYGVAARETLQSLELWDGLQHKLVFGENISQALLMVVSGNASLGIVATSQLAARPDLATACRWDIPQELHAQLAQQAVLLALGRDVPAAAGFLKYLKSEAARQIISSMGYGLP